MAQDAWQRDWFRVDSLNNFNHLLGYRTLAQKAHAASQDCVLTASTVKHMRENKVVPSGNNEAHLGC
jgi:hypothetical protein